MSSGYRTLGVIADGGMAEICLAQDAEGGAVALKRIKRPFDRDPEFTAMFEDEGQLWSRLRHPNVVRALDVGVDEQGPFIAMELVDGLDLAQILARRAGAPLPIGFILTVGGALLDALDYLHNHEGDDGEPLGLVHRDVSPGNVLCSVDGEVKLTDFGVVQAPVKTHTTRVGDLKGKFAYMSPEQTRGEELNTASDLFSAGIVLWEMLGGRSLFDRDTDVDTAQAVRADAIEPITALRDDVSPELDGLVAELLDRDPAARPSSAAAAARRMRAIGRALGLAPGAAAITEVVGVMVQEVGRAAERAVPVVRRRTRLAPDPTAGGARASARRRVVALVGAGAVVLGAVLAFGYAGGWAPAVPDTLIAPDASGAVDGARATVGLALQAPDAAPQEVDAGPASPAAPDAASADHSSSSPRLPIPRPPVNGVTKRPGAGQNGSAAGRGYGTLDLSSEPWAEIAIDGVAIGKNTPLRGFPVAAGKHRLTLHNPHFDITKTIVIEVAPGARTRKVVDLTAR